MSEKENKNLEQNRLQAEIDKINAETEKIKKEQEEIEERTSQKWYNLGLKIFGLIISIVMLIAAWVSIISPLVQFNNRLAEYKIDLAEYKLDLAEAKLDSALAAKVWAEKKEMQLRNEVLRITSRFDSMEQVQKVKRDSITDQLKKEKAKNQLDRRKIRDLESQLVLKNTQIKHIENDKEQIVKIMTSYSLLSGRVVTSEDGGKFPLNGVLVMTQDGSVKDTTDENGNFELKIPASEGEFEYIIFHKSNYREITRNLRLPNKRLEIFLEKG